MRVTQPPTSRSFPTDRSPISIAQGTTQDITAGASVVNATYTVPPNRRAEIRNAAAYGTVSVALAAGQTAELRVDVTRSGGALQAMARVFFSPASAIGTRDSAEPGSYFLAAGDQIEVRAAIGAGAGTLRSTGSLNGVEYAT